MRELEGRRIAVFGRGSQFEPADFEVASRTFLLLTTEITSSKQIYHLAVIVPSYHLPLMKNLISTMCHLLSVYNPTFHIHLTKFPLVLVKKG